MGIYLGHDLGACLLQGGKISVMIEEERLNRYKHGRPNSVAGLWPQFSGMFGYFPWASMNYCLEAAGLSIDELDLIVVGDDLWASGAADSIAQIIPIRDKKKVIYIKQPVGAVHHYHHALSAYMASPFDHAAVLVIDADGNSSEDGYEAESGYEFTGREGRYKNIFKNRYTDKQIPRSGIGWAYEQISYLLGFSNKDVFLAEPGKTMGLAAYGKSRTEFEEPWISIDGFRLDFSGFRCWLTEHGYQDKIFGQQVGLARVDGKITQYAQDLAYKVQVELESAVIGLARETQKKTGAKKLCIAGGVGLNSVANGRLQKEGIFEQIFVQPACNDAGQSIGLAYHAHLLLTSPVSSAFYSGVNIPAGIDTSRFSGEIKPIKHAFGGRDYHRDEITQLLDKSGLDYEELPSDDVLVKDAASHLEGSDLKGEYDSCNQNIFGWFQGGSEYGPRALGHRSIVANPSSESMMAQLNKRVKFRESFRPFAPSILQEQVNDVFELDCPSAYMLMVANVREKWRSRVPAIVHADGTARIQTVDMQVDPIYYGLISEFEKLSGIPLVLNTSFNLRGMPIVEAPYDALSCFLQTDMDVLYINRFKIKRPRVLQLVPCLNKNWLIEKIVSSDTEVDVICRNIKTSSIIRFEVSKEMAELLVEIDSEQSLGDLAGFGALKNDPPHDCITLIQRLVRDGIMHLKVGELVFGQLDDAKHWWQG